MAPFGSRCGLPLPAVRLADEACDEGRCRVVVELARASHLLEPALVHHGDAVGHHERLGLVVRDVGEGGVERALQLLQLDLHVLAQLEIERAERLVEEHEGRLEHEAAGDRHALALAAGQRRHAPLAETFQADALQHAAPRAPRPPRGQRRGR